MKVQRIFIVFIGVLIAFAALARGAHDLWSATLVHILIGALVVSILMQRNFAQKSICWTGGIPSLLIFGAVLLAVPSAANRGEALFSFRDIFASLLLFFTAANTIVDDHDRDLLAKILVPVFWIQAIVSIKQGNLANLSNNPSTLINANLQAAFLLAWWPVLLDRSITSLTRGAAVRWYWLSAFAAVSVSFILAWSLSAWAVFVVCLTFWGQQMGIPLKKSWMGAGLLVIFLVGLSLFEIPNSFTNRIGWWKTALNMFSHNPFWGVGLGNYPSAFMAYKASVSENTISPHSWIFQALGEMGGLGVVAIGVFLFTLWKETTLFAKKTNLQKSYFLGGAAALAYSAVNLGSEYFLIRMLIPIFLFSSGAFEFRIPKPRLSLVILVAGLYVLSMPYLISPFLSSRHFVTGQLLLKEARIEEAEKSFRIASELDGNNWEVHQALARISFEKFLFRQDPVFLDAAVADQNRAIEKNRLNGRLWWELGTYVSTSGNSAQAELYFQKARDLGFIFSSSSS